MNTPNYVLDTQNKISSYLAKLAESLKESNQDFRNIGPSKRLHRHAEASGFDNWQQMLAKLQEIEFTTTLVNEYGLSEEYSVSAWQTLKNNACNPNYPTGAAELAHNYCLRFNIQKKEHTPEDAESTSNDLFNDAKSHYESLSTALEKDDREFFDDSVYASTAESVDLSFSLSSNTSLHLKVSISDLNVISGYVRTGGFGKPAIIHLDSEQVDKASITMSYKIKEAIFDVSVMNYE
jgi:hypothetical protein